MAGQTTTGNFSRILRDKVKSALENYEKNLIKEIDYEALTWELMTLLDSIEIESDEGYEDPAVLARQRFDILAKYGLKRVTRVPVSTRKQ